MRKKVLGKGLGALIPEAGHPEPAPSEIDIDQITTNPDQPRLKFDEKSLNELSDSIRIHGVLQPVLVRPLGSAYQLVAGERRLMAAQRAGLLKVPAFVRDVPDDHLLELALIENIQREQLNPIEEAQAYHNLIESLPTTQEELAGQLGKERSTIANALRLLKLPPAVKLLVAEGKLSPGHARALLAANLAPAETTRAANVMVAKGWSVRDAERWAKKSQSARARASIPQDPNITAAADRLRLLLGTKVEITGGQGVRQAGQIRIHFFSQEDLTRIYSIIIEKRRHDGGMR
ncbi:MAG: ParB/RepB/Spo0J family partition protein [Acidobacteriia bacterium]|nr:ParB/RepB/Spo0J family partition protein [Terriglobia bacterium]